MNKLALVVESCYGNLNLVGLCIRVLSSQLFDEQQCNQVEVCVIEAVTNCIEHSYREAAGKDVQITCQLLADRIVIDIADSGIGMAPDFLEKRPISFEFDPMDIDGLPEGGMGLAIIKSWMDEVSYSSQDGVNHLTLVKYAQPQSEQAA